MKNSASEMFVGHSIKHFISTSTGAQDAKGNDVLLLDAGKLPRRENFTYKKDFDNEARNLIS